MEQQANRNFNIDEMSYQILREDEQALEETIKVERLFSIGEMPHQRLGNDKEQDSEARVQLEREFQNLTIRDIDHCEMVIPYQEEIKDLLDSITNKEALEQLQAFISEIANQAKQRQIFKKNPTKVLQFNLSIEDIIQKIIELIKGIERDAQGAYLVLTQRYFSKTAKEFNLEEKILEEIRRKLLYGLGLIFGGLLAKVGGVGMALTVSKAVGTLAIGSRVGMVGLVLVSLFLLGVGAYTLYQRYQLKKKYPQLVKFYEEMKKLNSLEV